jgi:hypothetical protein
VGGKADMKFMLVTGPACVFQRNLNITVNADVGYRTSLCVPERFEHHGECCTLIGPVCVFQRDLNITVNADDTLSSFCNWQLGLNHPEDSHPNHHDVAILITRYDHQDTNGAHIAKQLNKK